MACKGFKADPTKTLHGATDLAPASVVVVAVMASGEVEVFSSESTPLTFLMLDAGRKRIDELAEADG